MIVKPYFMEDETLFEYTDDGIILTEKGKKDKEVVKEYQQFLKDLKEYR